MGGSFGVGTISLLLLLASTAQAQSPIFDVTKYGGKSDITTALLSAWKEACASTIPSKVVIPKGTFSLGLVQLNGPCKSATELEVQGIVQAPADPTVLTDSWITFSSIDQFTVTGGGTFDGQGQKAWTLNDCATNKKCKSLAMNLRFNFITNGLVKGVTTLNSKNFHVNVLGCKNLTFDHFTITAPAESLNTDGIHIGRSIGVNIINSNIGTGDDCISLGDGSQNVNVTKVTCGPGHGISVGSLGKYPNEEPVTGLFVKNCTISNTDNGVRIKTWPALAGGVVSNIHFEDIFMDNVANPVILDQWYCPWNQCSLKSPSKVQISNVSFKRIWGTSTSPIPVNVNCSALYPCQQVEIRDIDLRYVGAQPVPAKSACTNAKLVLTGKIFPPGC